MSSIREKVRGLLGTSTSPDAESAADKKKKEEDEKKKKEAAAPALDAGKVSKFQAGFRGVK